VNKAKTERKVIRYAIETSKPVERTAIKKEYCNPVVIEFISPLRVQQFGNRLTFARRSK